MAIAPVPAFPFPRRPFSSITPFTYSDAMTHLELLEKLRVYAGVTLPAEINKVLDEYSVELTGEVQDAIDLMIGTLNDKIIEINDALADQQADYTQKIADLTVYVDNAVQQIINSSIEVQDPVVAGIVSDIGSQTRQALDVLYLRLSNADSVVSDNIQNGDSNTRQSLESLYPHKGSDMTGTGGVPTMYPDGIVATSAEMGIPTIGYPCIVDNRDGFIPGVKRFLAFYSTDHTGGASPGIMFSGFDEHGGDWTQPVSIVNRGDQLETPWVIFDRARGRLLLYASGMNMSPDQTANQVTVVWETTPTRFANDRTDWTFRGVSHDWENAHQGLLTNSGEPAMHTGYQKPAIIGGGFVSRGLSTGSNLGTQETWISTTGIKWFRAGNPSANQVDVNDLGGDLRILIDHFFTWQGETWGVGRYRQWGTSGVDGGTGTRVAVGRMRDSLAGFAGRPYSVFTPGDGGDVRGYCLVITDSVPHLYYSSTPNEIMLARAV